MLPIRPSDKEPSLLRSGFRISFIKELLAKANVVIGEFVTSSGWNDASNNLDILTNHPLIHKHLIQPTAHLIEALNKRPKGNRKTEELLLLAFDEAANLWVGPSNKKKDGTLFFTLRRILGILKDTPLWTFLLSTQSSTEVLLPSWAVESSNRILKGD